MRSERSSRCVTRSSTQRNKDGSYIWILDRGLAERDAAGDVIRMAGMESDITERKQSRAALILSEAKARAIFDQTFEFIGLLDTEGTVIDVNQAAMKFAGVSADQVLHRPFWETPGWTHSDAEHSRLRDAIRRAAAGEFVRFEATHQDPSGALHVIDSSNRFLRNNAAIHIHPPND
jgi:PAS domain S-box-containing protein